MTLQNAVSVKVGDRIKIKMSRSDGSPPLTPFAVPGTLLSSYLNKPERQSARVGMLTYFVRATRRAHFRIWPSTPCVQHAERQWRRKRVRMINEISQLQSCA
jgi:hypothetical protein